MKECCVSGHFHEGTPSGEETTFGGLPTYVTGPKEGKTAIFYITDIFGWKFNNARLLADEYAQQLDLPVYMPDVFDGDAYDYILPSLAPTTDADKGTISATVDKALIMPKLMAWMGVHREAVSKPIIDGFATELASKYDKIIAIGLCWSTRYAYILAREGKAQVAIANHPSGFTPATDANGIKAPVQLNVGEKDEMFPGSSIGDVKKIWDEEGKTNYEIHEYPRAVHGFAVRADLSDQEKKEGKEACLANVVKFIKAN